MFFEAALVPQESLRLLWVRPSHTSRAIDRRLSPRRIVVNPAIHVSLGGRSREVLFDLSEGGLSIYGVNALPTNNVFDLAFQLPEGAGLVEAQAGVAWTSTAKNRTGICFISVSESSRERLRDWMDFRQVRPQPAEEPRINDWRASSDWRAETDWRSVFASSTAEFPASNVLHDSEPRTATGPFLAPRTLDFAQQSTISEATIPEQSSVGIRARVAMGLAAFIVLAVAYLLGSHSLFQTKPPEPAPAAESTQKPAVNSSTLPAAAPLDSPGFMLQAGAMAIEENADALSRSLQQKNFPAFVFKRTNDRFYRVAVGPYADLATAMRVKAELDRQHVATIQRAWTPE